VTTTRAVETGDGRTLLVHEAGDPTGPIVVYQHGTPSDGRLYEPWVEDAKRRGIRLVGYDRPGYGGSTRHPDRRVVDAARDVQTIVDALGGGRFGTWGISGGAPHALACAAALRGEVIAAASLAAPVPYGAAGLDWLAGMGEGNVAEFGAALEGEAALRPMLEQMRAEALAASPEQLREEMASILSPVDFAVFSGELGTFLDATLSGGLEPGADGWLDDDLAFVADWGFELGPLPAPTLLVQGGHDLMVPPAHFHWLADHVPNGEVRFEPDEGHLTLYEHAVPAVHEWLLRFF
jgi:pimeloyl-ACP methyl ester carboxylesterase